MFRIETWASKRALTTSYRRTRPAALLLAKLNFDGGSTRKRNRVTRVDVYETKGAAREGGKLIFTVPDVDMLKP